MKHLVSTVRDGPIVVDPRVLRARVAYHEVLGEHVAQRRVGSKRDGEKPQKSR
jgi:hypothetical protein